MPAGNVAIFFRYFIEAIRVLAINGQHLVGNLFRLGFDDDVIAGVQGTQVIEWGALAHAVLVWSNQQQTFKSEQIAQEAIANLGL